jgi:tetratricopeptide (TPR) repeat protein
LKLGKYRLGSSRPTQEKSGSPEEVTPVLVTRVSRRRLWLFRFAITVFGPLVVFGSAELILRVIGYGYPTSFFLPACIKRQQFYVPNPKFTFRFFSASLARPPLPIRVPVEKSTQAYRIFLFGESAAAGDPDPSYGAGRYLQVLLRERFPKSDFEVFCVAVTGISSHTILPIARECALHDGDLWLIYMGNNEMVGPFGAETVFGAQAPSLSLARASLALKTTRVGQLLDAVVSSLHRGPPSPESWGGMQIGVRGTGPAIASPSRKSWGGMQMFTEARVRHDAPARLRTYANFESNLRDILRAGRRAGVPVILSTVAVNLKDCPPFASLHGPGLTKDKESEWTKAYAGGVELEAAGDYRAALAHYAEALRIDAEYADLQFRIGTCEAALTNCDRARRSFALATDYDALAFKADTAINQTIRATAQRAGQGVYLVDAAEALAQHSPAGIPGLELFYEHVHLNFEGNYLLALNFAEQVRKLLPESIRARDTGNWASAERCNQRLGVTVWDRQRVWQPIFNRISFPPFTGQLDHAAFVKRCEAKLNEARALMTSQTPEQARQVYEQAVAWTPDDDILHGNFESFLQSGGKLTEALAESRRICELAPYLPAPFYGTGRLLVRLGKVNEAKECFEQAIALRGDFAQAHDELGLIFAGQQKPREALACFSRALKADPTFVDTYWNRGLVEQREGKIDQALADYEAAARLQPHGPADYLNRAVSLAACHRSAQAIECLQTLVQQVPELWQARYLLGMELAGVGRSDEAKVEFSVVLRYRPDYGPMLPQSAVPADGKTSLEGKPGTRAD